METYKKYLNDVTINEGYTATELSKIDPNAQTVDIVVMILTAKEQKLLD
jgi:hypothetical protein